MTSLLGQLGRVFNRAPVPYAGRRGFGMSLAGQGSKTAQMEAYGTVGMLFAVVSRLADATSSVNWRLYRTRDGRGQLAGGEERKEVTDHVLLDLLAKPNPFYTQKTFIETYQQHIDLTGEGIWLVGRSPMSPMPLELWPVRPDRMEPVPHPTQFLAGWVYTGPNGEKVPLEVDEVIQTKMPNP